MEFTIDLVKGGKFVILAPNDEMAVKAALDTGIKFRKILRVTTREGDVRYKHWGWLYLEMLV